MVEKIKERGLALSSMLSVFVVAGLLGAGPASATPADPVGDAFDEMQGKITTYGAAIVGLVVLSVGIFLGIKYLRKGVSKA